MTKKYYTAEAIKNGVIAKYILIRSGFVKRDYNSCANALEYGKTLAKQKLYAAAT